MNKWGKIESPCVSKRLNFYMGKREKKNDVN